MSELQTNVPATLVSSSLSPAGSRHGAIALRTCLVVTGSTHRAAQFVEAAQQEHWSTIVSRTAEDAARNALRLRIQMALVDLESASSAEDTAFRKLIEQLAGRNGPLLAVCGKPNDDAAEIWSRRLGVWMYLPGINNQSDIGLLYGQARSIVEKLENGNTPQRIHEANGKQGTNGASHGTRTRG